MGEFDLEALVLDVVRNHTNRPDAGPGSRFERDLHLSANGRNALFAFLVEAFNARGVNLPSRSFFLSDFVKCETPAEVQSAIRDTLSGVRKKSTTGAPKPAPMPPTAATPVTVAITSAAGNGKLPANQPAAGKAKKLARTAAGKKAAKRKARR